MLPTLEEWIIIAMILIIVVLAPQLPDIGDRLGRLLGGVPKE